MMLNLDRHEWSHPVWNELKSAYRRLYRNQAFSEHAESVFRQIAYECNCFAGYEIVTWKKLVCLYEYQAGLCFGKARQGESIQLGLDFQPVIFIPSHLGDKAIATIDNVVLCTQEISNLKVNKDSLDFLVELGDVTGALHKLKEMTQNNLDLQYQVVMTERQLTLDSLYNQGTQGWLDKQAK